MNIKYEFRGTCSHCKKKITTKNAEFTGGIGSGKPMGFYAICPRCGWETSVSSFVGIRKKNRGKIS